jgi:hypothetical protein
MKKRENMFNVKYNFWSFEKTISQEFSDHLDKGLLLLQRLNEDEDIVVGKVNSLTKKSHQNNIEKFYNLLECILLISTKISSFADFELQQKYMQSLDSASEHVFNSWFYLSNDEGEKANNFIISFYKKNSKKELTEIAEVEVVKYFFENSQTSLA